MSAMSSKDRNLLLVAVVGVLYAFAALTAKKQVESWKVGRNAYRAAQKRLAEERALIAADGEWKARYEEVRDLMPTFAYERDVATHWLNVMDSVASRNGLTISRRQTGKELEVGDVFELPIECKDWEGSLESLVRFLYELSSEGAMLDVRQLFIRPSNRPGYLKGTFTLYCAYMRGDVERVGAGARRTAEPPAAEAAAAEPSGGDAAGDEGQAAPEPAQVQDGGSQ